MAFPVVNQNFRPKYNGIQWRNNKMNLKSDKAKQVIHLLMRDEIKSNRIHAQ